MTVKTEASPWEADVKIAKDNGCVVEKIDMDGHVFVYRSLNRLEWKSLQQETLKRVKGPDGNVDPNKVLENKEDSEDSVVLKALIYPKHGTSVELAGYPAGYIAQLADRITELSGFGESDVAPERL